MRTSITRSIYLNLLLFVFLNHATAQPLIAKHGMVVSENKLASQIGSDILRAGGNAVDAAVAVGYALAVVNPCCGNIGGGGFMTIHFANGKDTVLNFREKAPLKAKGNMYLDAQGNVMQDKSTLGYLAVAVPGTVLGLDTALQRYGSMTRTQVMAPAIKLAQQGYTLTPYEAKLLQVHTNYFREEKNVAHIFLKNGQPYQAGERLIQHDLANTLTLIAQQGPNVFYKGQIAKEIVKSSQAHGGILTLKDFSSYKVKELAPLHCTYRGYALILPPPPSSGITLCEMLNILENFSLNKSHYGSAQDLHLIVETMRYGFTDRNTKLGDPDFVTNPIEQLLSKKYAASLSKKIKASNVATPSNIKIKFHEQTDTTHYSVVDSKGNAVAVTYTLDGFFGAKVIADHTGFFLNDEMDDFTVKPGTENKFELVQSDKNRIQPGKRPFSSMTPTIVMKGDHLFMVLGSPGGPRIITSVLLTLLNVIDYGLNIKEAIHAPRYHYQVIPDTIDLEPFALTFFTAKELTSRGYHLRPQKPWSAVEAIVVGTDGTLYGANDERRPDGAAVGY